MAETVIKRRLKSLREKTAEKQSKASEARLRKAERDTRDVVAQADASAAGVTVYMLRAFRRQPIALPLAAYYSRDDAFEARRARFYAHVALIYGSQGWIFQESALQVAAEAGYGGIGREVQPIDQTSKVSMNVMSAPLEWLVAKGRMETKRDTPGAGMVRYSAALRYRDDMVGAGMGLAAQSYEGASGGGRPGRPPSDFKMDCMHSVASLRGIKGYSLLEAVVWKDEWIWKTALRRRVTKAEKGQVLAVLRKRANRMILDLHRILDLTAMHYGLMSATEFRKRWTKRRRSLRKVPDKIEDHHAD